MTTQEYQLRREIVRVGQLMYDRGLVSATEGNISARLDSERILITPSGIHKGFLSVDQLLIVDEKGMLVGSRLGSARGLKPTSELPLHLEVYKRREDVRSVVHAHPPTTIALSIAGISLAECLLPEVIVFLGLIPTAAYATPSSPETAQAIRPLIANHDALILQRHGTITVGSSPMEGFMRLEIVEQNARISYMLAQLGEHHPLPTHEVEKLLKLRVEMGLCKPGESTEFCRVCGVCHSGVEHLPTVNSSYRNGINPAKNSFGSPSSLPPIKQRTVQEDKIRELVAEVLKKTIGDS